MKRVQCGQIWLVNFDPSFGHQYKKVRPALIAQNNKYLTEGSFLTIIPISSQVNRKMDIEVVLPKDDQNRLILDSLIKTKQISSFDMRRFIKLMGTVHHHLMKDVKQKIQDFLIGDEQCAAFFWPADQPNVCGR